MAASSCVAVASMPVLMGRASSLDAAARCALCAPAAGRWLPQCDQCDAMRAGRLAMAIVGFQSEIYDLDCMHDLKLVRECMQCIDRYLVLISVRDKVEGHQVFQVLRTSLYIWYTLCPFSPPPCINTLLCPIT